MSHLDEVPGGVDGIAPAAGYDAIEVDRSGGDTVVRVHGDLDGDTARALNLCLCGLASGGLLDLVVDLDEVSFCDSTGLGVLLGVHRRLAGGGGRLEVRQPAPDVRHVLEERGLDRVLHLT